MSYLVNIGHFVGGMFALGAPDLAEAEFAAQAAEYDAKALEQDAGLARQQASEEERKLRVIARKQIGAMEAGYGASGVKQSGSALDVLQESAAAAEKDAQMVKYAGELKAWGFEREAARKRWTAENYRTMGYINAATTAIGSGARIAAMGG